MSNSKTKNELCTACSLKKGVWAWWPDLDFAASLAILLCYEAHNKTMNLIHLQHPHVLCRKLAVLKCTETTKQLWETFDPESLVCHQLKRRPNTVCFYCMQWEATFRENRSLHIMNAATTILSISIHRVWHVFKVQPNMTFITFTSHHLWLNKTLWNFFFFFLEIGVTFSTQMKSYVPFATDTCFLLWDMFPFLH